MDEGGLGGMPMNDLGLSHAAQRRMRSSWMTKDSIKCSANRLLVVEAPLGDLKHRRVELLTTLKRPEGVSQLVASQLNEAAM